MTLTCQWQYRFGQPSSTGTLKATPEDFFVGEQLGFEPSGEGEHLYVYVRKVGLNTVQVAEALAKFAGIHPKFVAYSGRKDKHAVTEQWFALHLPGKDDPDLSSMAMDGLTILRHQRHNKKLRTGTHKHNQFALVLRDISRPDKVETRLELLHQGVPNYFGEQRFGRHHSNLHWAERLMSGETIRHRQKRSMAISALRSWLFNGLVSKRLEDGLFEQPMAGDVMMLAGSNSFFTSEQLDDTLLERLQQRDIMLSAPLWGKGELASTDDALEWERRAVDGLEAVTSTLNELGLRQERRAIQLFPNDLNWQWQDNHLHLTFHLPTGCFATSVVRELIEQPKEVVDETASK